MNSHHLLINEYPLIVQPSLVMAIGLEQAIILQQIHYWLARSTNVQEGRKWVYNSYEAWHAQFPWMSAVTIKRYILGMEKAGYLISDNFNKLKIDQTKWYTIDYNQLAEVVSSVSKSDTSTVSEFDPHWSDPTPSVPETTTETNAETSTIPTAPSTLGAARVAKRRLPEEIATWRPKTFAAAWEYFGRVGSVVKAAEAWDQQKPDEDMDEVIAAAIDQQRVAYGWGRPEGSIQPHFVTWLNQQRWNDNPQARAQPRRSVR